MSSTEPTRFADREAMLLAGIRREHTYAGGTRGIPAQWEEFQRLGEIPGQRGRTAFGVICGAQPEKQVFEYMTGVEVDGFDALPPDLGRMRVPPQHYAVFTHDGHISTIRATWAAIWSWLPRSGYESAWTPDFEVYGERFDPATGLGGVEIWVPVRPAEPAESAR